MNAFIEALSKVIGLPQRGRPAFNIALYGPAVPDLDLVSGVECVLKYLADVGLSEADSISLMFYGTGDLEYKTYKLSSWLKRGKPLPKGVLSSIQIDRFVSKEDRGLTDYVWTAEISPSLSFLLCVDRQAEQQSELLLDEMVRAIQNVGRFDYGYAFEMPMERGPAFYINGSTLSVNGKDSFTRSEEEEIAKWMHAKGECKKLGLSVGDLIRDVFPKNYLNPRHLDMRVKGQSLKDWIESDPKRGTLSPLIENELWVWNVPENRIKAVRKVLGKERLLVSWGDFNTPSGGPMGSTYGANDADVPAFNGQPLSKDERDWVASGLVQMKPILERYTGETVEAFDKLIEKRNGRFPDLLDSAFTAWSQDASTDRPSSSDALQAFGAALGEHLIKCYRMAWYAVEDEHGRRLSVCLRGKHGEQTWAHPFDSVAKRIDLGETGFVAGVVEAVGEQIR